MAASRLGVTLLSNASTSGSAVEWPGGDGRVEVRGNFGGTSVSLEVLNADASTWHTVGTDTTFTAAGTSGFKLEAGCIIQMSVTGGSPSGLYATAYRI